MASSNQGAAYHTPPEALSNRTAQLEPFDWFAEMRNDQPVRYDEQLGRWDVFRYDDVNQIIRDHERFTGDIDSTDVHLRDINFDRGSGTNSMIRNDPPEHGRLRNFANSRFQPGTLENMRPRLEHIVDALLDDIETSTEIDLVSEFSHPFPVTVIAELLGLPRSDHEQFIRWSDRITMVPSHDDTDEIESVLRRRERAQKEMWEYFSKLITERADGDSDDLITLAATNDELRHEEKISFCRLLLVAGNVTTINLITNAVWCFEENDLFDAVRTGSVGRREAIEEVLRYRSPVQNLRRVTTEPVELGGKQIDAGELVVAWNGSANRDSAIFDAPDEFRPGRSPNRHLSFGGGIHFCLGAPLARLEADIALEKLLDRFEVIEPNLSDLVPRSRFHGLKSLPCTLETDRS